MNWHEHVIGADELMAAPLPPPNWIVNGLIPEGLTLIVGKPKVGKSWFALDIAVAVATGGAVLGKQTETGDVLFLALEDNTRRMQTRIRKLLGENETSALSRLKVTTRWAKMGQGCVEDIRKWSESVVAPRLVVIDTLGCIRGLADRRHSAYQDDIAALRPLHALAKEMGFAILVIHHVRKMTAEDPLDQVSGTTGLAGTADTTLVLDRRADTGLTLRGRGRDLEDDIDLAVQFNREMCRLSVRGHVDEVRRSPERTRVLAALEGAPEGLTPARVAAETGMDPKNLKQLMRKMADSGELMKPNGRGTYAHPRFAIAASCSYHDYHDYRITNDN